MPDDDLFDLDEAAPAPAEGGDPGPGGEDEPVASVTADPVVYSDPVGEAHATVTWSPESTVDLVILTAKAVFKRHHMKLSACVQAELAQEIRTALAEAMRLP